jgi:hypothetical protein
MTTPARNKNVTTFAQALRRFPNGSVSVVGNPIKTHDIDIRPISASAAKIGRFKKCLPFNHSGGAMVKLNSVENFQSVVDPSQKYVDSGNIFDGDLYPSLVMPTNNMRNMCLVKALAKLKSQEFHLGNFLAEGGKTINMVAFRANTIANQVLSFRRKHPKLWDKVKQWEPAGPRHHWCNIPDLWLELQYGWKPLLSDVYGAVHHLAKRQSKFGLPFVEAKASVADDVYLTTQHTSAIGTINQARWLNRRTVETFLVYGMTNPVLAELSSLGLINPLEIVWEVSRYSFVVDWFLPIGPWLSALTADVGYTFITGGQSLKARATFVDSSVVSTPIGWKVTSPAIFGASGFSQNWQRVCYDTPPVPGLYVKNPLSSLHLANALALLVQAFR